MQTQTNASAARATASALVIPLPLRGYRPQLRPQALYYTMEQMAAALDWTVERTRRHLVRSGAAFKRAGRWYTTKSLLRAALAQEAPELIAVLDEHDASRRQRFAR